MGGEFEGSGFEDTSPKLFENCLEKHTKNLSKITLKTSQKSEGKGKAREGLENARKGLGRQGQARPRQGLKEAKARPKRQGKKRPRKGQVWLTAPGDRRGQNKGETSPWTLDGPT